MMSKCFKALFIYFIELVSDKAHVFYRNSAKSRPHTTVGVEAAEH
jgi:hypothetical protein